jgi:hypothetical protein
VAEDTLDPVWAWAVARQPGALAPSDLAPAWAFVVGAECFQYRQVFGDPFKRLAFAEALKAGHEGEPFPLGKIVARCKEAWPGLAKGRQRVLHIPTEPWVHPTKPTAPGPRRELVNRNAPLLLSIAQEVPYTLPAGHALDIEHLYPQAHKAAMKWQGATDDKHSCHHPNAWDTNRAGNLLWLDAALNRAAQDDWPEAKLVRYRSAPWTPPLFLAADEEELLTRACQKIRGKHGKGAPGDPARDGVPMSVWMGDAMDCFARYVQRRELRVFAEVVRRYPGVLEMGGEEPGEA